MYKGDATEGAPPSPKLLAALQALAAFKDACNFKMPGSSGSVVKMVKKSLVEMDNITQELGIASVESARRALC